MPTVVELGCGDLVADNYFGVSGPAGLPQDVSDKLAQALAEIAAQPATVERFEELGITTLKMSPAATSGFVPKQTKDWAPTIDAADAMRPGVPLRIGRYELVFHVGRIFAPPVRRSATSRSSSPCRSPSVSPSPKAATTCRRRSRPGLTRPVRAIDGHAKTPAVFCIRADTSPSWCIVSP